MRPSFAWFSASCVLHIISAYTAFFTWWDWDGEAAAFIAECCLRDPYAMATVIASLCCDPGGWWLTVFPVAAVLSGAGSVFCLLRAFDVNRRPKLRAKPLRHPCPL